MVYVAPWAERKLLVDFWMLGEASWGVELGRGLLEREFAGGLIF